MAIIRLDGGRVVGAGLAFQAIVRSRALSAGIKPQDKMQIYRVSFCPVEEAAGMEGFDMRVCWLRESKQVLVHYSRVRECDCRRCVRNASKRLPINQIERVIPDMIHAALSQAGIDVAGYTVTSVRFPHGIIDEICQSTTFNRLGRQEEI